MTIESKPKEKSSESGSWEDLNEAFSQAANAEQNTTAKDRIMDGFLGQVAFATGAFTGSLHLLEQGLPFKEQLKDSFEFLTSPGSYLDRKKSESNKLSAVFRSAIADPKGTLLHLAQGTKDFLIHASASYIKASPTERAEALGEIAPGLSLSVMSPDLEGVQGATVPYGLGSVRKFNKVTGFIQNAAQDEEALVGIRGSAATGIRFRGGKFGHQSDFDFFVASDKLFKEGLERGAKPRKGAFYVWDTKRFFPKIHEVEGQLKDQLARKSCIRIFSRDGFKRFFKTGKEILRP